MRVKVIVEDGVAKVMVEGVKGNKCIALTKELEEKLGKITEVKKTSEYYETPQNTNQLEIKQ